MLMLFISLLLSSCSVESYLVKFKMHLMVVEVHREHLRVGKLQMGFEEVVLLLSPSKHFIKVVVDVKAPGPSSVLKWSLGVGKGMLLVRYFCSNKSFLHQLYFKEILKLS